MPHDENSQPVHRRSSFRIKLALLVLTLIAVGVAYSRYGDILTLSHFAEQESRLRELQAQQPVLVIAAAMLIYVGVTGLSLPGATVLTLLYGWYFGFWVGLVVVSLSSTAGATMAFLLCRFFFRESILNRFGDRLQKFNESLEKEGPFFLFSLRLIPAVPFFVINAVMGLTPIRTSTFWWVSQIGMFPGTMVYVYAGSIVPNLDILEREGLNAVFTPNQLTQILLAFVMLGCFPFVVRGLLRRFGGRAANAADPPTDSHGEPR